MHVVEKYWMVNLNMGLSNNFQIWSTFHEPELVFRQFNRTFEKLNISYIDLLLIHYPISYGIRHKDGSDQIPHDVEDFESYPHYENGSMVYVEVNPKNTWRAFEKLVHDKLVRAIGVSNFNSHQVDYILSIAKIKPVINQVEIHPNLSQLKLINFLKSRNMLATAYSALGRPHSVNDTDMAFRNPTVQKLALKYQKTSAQILLRFVVYIFFNAFFEVCILIYFFLFIRLQHQLGVVIASNAVLKNHLIDNLNIFDFSLNQDDMNIMHKFNNNHRLSKFIHDVNHKDYPFKTEY